MQPTSAKVKAFFESNPEIGYKIEQAYGKRKCFICKDDILKNEWAMCDYMTHFQKKYKTRRNVCLICALPIMRLRHESIAKFVEMATQHLKEHPEIQNRKILKSFQDGTHDKPKAHWEEL